MAITREPLTRLRIVELASDIIDTEGLPALNMRRLAASAGVQPMSLYHHFPNKESMLAAVAESIAAATLGDASAPARGPAGPERRTRLLFTGLHELVQAHPRALPLITTGVLRTPSGRRWMEELMSVLLEAGFAPDAARASTTARRVHARSRVRPAPEPRSAGRDHHRRAHRSLGRLPQPPACGAAAGDLGPARRVRHRPRRPAGALRGGAEGSG